MAFFQFDPDFEFSAPQYYDFTVPETPEQVREAERWFYTSASHGASPFSIRSRDFYFTPIANADCSKECPMDISESPRYESRNLLENQFGMGSTGEDCKANHLHITAANVYQEAVDTDLFTPEKECIVSDIPGVKKTVTFSPGSLPAKRVHAEISKKIPHTEKPLPKLSKSIFTRQSHTDKTIRHDIQAMKKQKLEGGRLRQILHSKDEKNTSKGALTVPRVFNFSTDKRITSAKGVSASAVFKGGKTSSPYMSMAEKVQKFQMKTRDCFNNILYHSQDDCASLLQEKPKPKLTKPKEPELETSQRSRPARVKSTAELEAELLAKMPKFKARPLNKKILEGPTLPAPPKSKPVLPEFQEFHLRTTERALQHCGTASVCSNDSSFEELKQRRKSAPSGGITEPKVPLLATAARARPPKVKSTEEREQEELAKVPKFKARPLDKKIFYSRGDLGIFRNTKRQVTTPVEFHFATEERCHSQPDIPLDLFSKLSINSQQENHPPKPTKPEPFHLLTEDRGQKKELRMLSELRENELREREMRIPKANPLPCTTDYPEVPPRPHPKECTRPKPFCLESVFRHEEEMMRLEEEKRRLEEEEAERRRFHAQPITCIGPVFVPERSRKPLTEVHEFSLQVDSRAVERCDFDKKVAEKQNSYKRFREECEAARKAEEERLIKYMRRTMIPHARPVPDFEKPFVPKRCSKELTRPCSPKLSTSHRRERRNSLTLRRQSMTFSIQKRVQMR